jgi:hypothetical protein
MTTSPHSVSDATSPTTPSTTPRTPEGRERDAVDSSDSLTDDASRRESERSAWERFYSAALQGYMADPHVDPADDGVLDKMVAASEEIADASLVVWRRRWPHG